MSATLILGGVRSGKSRFAQSLAERSGLPVVYLATATAGDDEEMRERIARHRARRPGTWRTVEEPIELTQALQRITARHCVIVDCLTLWLTNLLLRDESRAAEAIEQFCAALPTLENEILLVSNEVGLGIIPAAPLSRRFCDAAGELHQRLADVCDRVVLMVAGIPQYLRGAE